MQVESPVPTDNRLIARLPLTERREFTAQATPVDLAVGDVLCELDQNYPHIYFPMTGLISMSVTMRGHESLEMGMIGNEGMLGATLLLGIRAAPLSGVVQGTGTALRMNVPKFRRSLQDSPGLVRTIGRYLYVSLAQLSQTVACNRFHEVEPRLARWLLMAHDRMHTDEFYITHQLLSDMLGVRRSAVTIAAGVLQNKELISYSRGNIKVLSRQGLETASCECYGAVVDDYYHLLS